MAEKTWIGVASLIIATPAAVVALFQLGLIGGDESGGTSSTTPSPVSTSGPAEAPAEDPGPTPSDTSAPGCTINITHFGAQLQAEPDHTARTLTDIPEGEYAVQDSEVANWAGKDELWFQIDVEGRVGWVVDLPILLDKSSACP